MSRRNQIRMTDDEVRDFVENGFTAMLTSIGPDGYPHPVAMWYTTIEGVPAFATYAKSQKVNNFRRHPKGAVLIEDGDTYDTLRGVLIQGPAEIVDDAEAAFAVMRGNYEKYTAKAKVDVLPEPVEQMLRAQSAKRAVVKVHPEKIISWDHRKLRGVY